MANFVPDAAGAAINQGIIGVGAAGAVLRRKAGAAGAGAGAGAANGLAVGNAVGLGPVFVAPAAIMGGIIGFIQG